MEKSLKNFIRFEDKLWFVDFTTPGSFKIRIVLPDGTSRPASKSDGDLMDVLNEGTPISDIPSNFNPNTPTLNPIGVSEDNFLKRISRALQRLKQERKKNITKEPEEIITLPNGKKVYKSLHELGKSLVSSMVKNLNEQTKEK